MISADILANRFPKSWSWWVECHCDGCNHYYRGGHTLTRLGALRKVDRTTRTINKVHAHDTETRRYDFEWTIGVGRLSETEALAIDEKIEAALCDHPDGHLECETSWVFGRHTTKTQYLDEEALEAEDVR